VEFTVQWLGGADPGRWAAEREAEGWSGVSTQDHCWAAWGPTYHLFVTLTLMIGATSTVRVSSAFANNLVRSPVDFAHAALMLADTSHGRYVAGLGAGWEAAEVRGLGLDYPDGPRRARRFREAILIIRELLHNRPCRFEGEFYGIDVPALSPWPAEAPPLAAAVAGDWTCRHISPLVDRVELAIPGPGNPFRSGSYNVGAVGSFGEKDLRHAVDLVHEVNEQAPISGTLYVAAGPESDVGRARSMVEGGLFETLVGEPVRVADNLRRLADTGITGATIVPLTDKTIEHLAPALVS
jgi:alkanesulfonate monooxygenase SsuD/methylene tetrahydromethanopterin reductase-like flavin-dependent oxidoreductase (luciferase family)